MLTKFYSKAPSLFSDPADPEKYKRNLLKVEVFYEEFNFELMEEKPAYYVSNTTIAASDAHIWIKYHII